MAADKKKKPDKEPEPTPPPPPISPAKRKMLQTQFERGSALAGKGEFDYANEMFTSCVAGDPGNVIYTQNFLNNLLRKYNNNKKGGKFAGLRGAGAKSKMSKCRRKKDWLGTIRNGLGYLKFNPWDTAVLTEIAAACAEFQYDDTRIEYLKVALAANTNDVDLNKAAALAFEDVADFDNAIKCWERIGKAKPNTDEVTRAIGHLTVQKTIHKGGYENAETSDDVRVDKKSADFRKTEDDVTPEVKLRREIRRKPEEVSNYIALSDHYWKVEDFENAEKIMQEGLDATGSIRAREYLEDVQLNRERRALALTQKKAAQEKSEKAIELYRQTKTELNSRELEIYGGRAERYPGNFEIKYQFGLRLYHAGKFKEAITQLQDARTDVKRVAAANLELGKCFHQLKKYDLALSSYQTAINSAGLWDEDVKKESLYHAGKLARGLKDYDSAIKYLTQLAGLEYGFRDVAELLDATRKEQQNPGGNKGSSGNGG
ncbi:MAG: tetratricopeptide repeat protein [Planctomycetia bacterium]|nr:tetratricopeptide repeat protein [Planctomycetia bacterium]